MAAKLLISLILLSLLSLSSPLPATSIVKSVEILYNSGYVSMSLTLEFGSKTLIPPSPYLTIFSPSDSAFASSGQPSLSLLRFHFSPISFSPQVLKSLPLNAKIPTFFPNHSLIVTSHLSNDSFSLNGVKIDESPIFDDGSLRIYGIEKFLDPDFHVSDSQDGAHSPSAECMRSVKVSDFHDAAKSLTEKGYSVMASFLALQLVGLQGQALVLTVFAPPDKVLLHYLGHYRDYASIFLRHVVPCRIEYWELLPFDGGELPTFLEGFKIKVAANNYDLSLSRVHLDIPHLYKNEWLMVHGVEDVLPEEAPGSSQIRTSIVDLKFLKILVVFSSLFLCFFSFW